MESISQEEKRVLFNDVMNRILAVEFSPREPLPENVTLLFGNKEYMKRAIYFLQDYNGIGFCLLLEKIDNNQINLKLYEPDTDDFNVCSKVVLPEGIFDIYMLRKIKPSFMSIGLLEIVNELPKIRIHPLKVPLQSITFQ